MTFDCKDLERALETPELLPDAREHARNCANCRNQMWLWGELSREAPGLREDWPTPELWPRIRQTLEAEHRAKHRRRRYDWRVLGSIAAVLLIGSALLLMRVLRPVASTTSDGDFLTEQALLEVEHAEAAYRSSIDKLAGLAQPKLTGSATPFAVADREKLLVLDSEIADVRSTVESNRFNARLRSELALLYREKQETLKEVLQSAQKF